MSRQSISYLVPEPLEPLNVEEVRYWLRIMQEHALFIKLGLPCDNTEEINDAEAFYEEFEALRLRAEKVQNDRKFAELVNEAYDLVKEFYCFKRHLLHLMLECKLSGCNYPLLLDHMAREAEYFLRLLDKMKIGKVPLSGGSKARENLFWVRIMDDHTKFISQLLDPSERNLINTANDFTTEFDRLLLQGQDFASMLMQYHEVPSFRRYLQDVRVSTTRLRDFKRAAFDMIEECKLISLIPALLADHVRREADHFLMILAMMDKGVMKNICLDEDIEREHEDELVDIEPKYEVDFNEREEVVESEFNKFEKPEEIVVAEPASEVNREEEVSTEKKPINKSQQENIVKENVKESKYNWSTKWPRPLGKA